jgi:hypothetical protein
VLPCSRLCGSRVGKEQEHEKGEITYAVANAPQFGSTFCLRMRAR